MTRRLSITKTAELHSTKTSNFLQKSVELLKKAAKYPYRKTAAYFLKNSLKSHSKTLVNAISISTVGLLYPFSTLLKIPVVTLIFSHWSLAMTSTAFMWRSLRKRRMFEPMSGLRCWLIRSLMIFTSKKSYVKFYPK